MGQEAKCVLRLGKERHTGTALLETSEIIFRSESLRLKIPFAKVQLVDAVNGELRFKTPNGAIVLELGTAAEKWREKILHPKTRIEKLGVKPNARVVLAGKFEAHFLEELRRVTKEIAKGSSKAPADCIFLALEGKKNLAQVAAASKRIQGAAALWVVYPKGKKEITEKDVIAAGREAGLKDVKVVGFSQTHTALKFVIPVEKR